MKKIGIFCVGTGGHVLPAKNIILQLNKEGVSFDEFIVVTDKRGSQYLEDLKIKIYIQDIYRSKIGFIGYIINIHKYLNSFLRIRSIVKKENVKLIFSTGSYIAPIASFLSFTLRIKYFGQEQNIYAGLGNKVSSFFPGLIFTSYPKTKNILKRKIMYVGPVINKNIIKNNLQVKDMLTIGIQGGSQGSEEVNKYLYKFISENDVDNIKFIHITGIKKSIKNMDTKNYEKYDFIEDMSKYYSKINIQISRSGGGALEAAYLNIPQILLPFKHGTTSSHQLLNAQYLEELGVALIVKTYDEFESKLIDIINKNENNIKDNFIRADIQIGNFKISEYLKKALNEQI